jgi:hypothetical protein
MIRLPKGMSTEDISQWLAHGTFMMEVGAERVPVAWLGSSGGVVDASRVDGQGDVQAPYYNCFAHWPDLGCFNSDQGFAFFAERITVKQYRRTMNARCVRFSIPSGWRIAEARDVSVRKLRSWPDLMPCIYKAEYPASFEELDAWLDAGRDSVALNRRLIISGDTVGKRLLYLDGRLTATVYGGMLHHIGGYAEIEALNKLTGGRYGPL